MKQKGINKTNGSDCRKKILQSGDRVAVRVMLQAVLAVGIRENECQEEGKVSSRGPFYSQTAASPCICGSKRHPERWTS